LTFTTVTDKGLLLSESRSGHTLTSLTRVIDKAVGVSERQVLGEIYSSMSNELTVDECFCVSDLADYLE
jgi:hypothetical protein